MEHSVAAVSGVNRTRRDIQRSPYSDYQVGSRKKTFADVLNTQLRKAGDGAVDFRDGIVDCCTTTYGRDSMMQDFHYQTREYHY